MGQSFVYKIRKDGHEDKWVKWSEAERLVNQEGWQFVTEGGNYVYRESSC